MAGSEPACYLAQAEECTLKEVALKHPLRESLKTPFAEPACYLAQVEECTPKEIALKHPQRESLKTPFAATRGLVTHRSHRLTGTGAELRQHSTAKIQAPSVSKTGP